MGANRWQVRGTRVGVSSESSQYSALLLSSLVRVACGTSAERNRPDKFLFYKTKRHIQNIRKCHETSPKSVKPFAWLSKDRNPCDVTKVSDEDVHHLHVNRHLAFMMAMVLGISLVHCVPCSVWFRFGCSGFRLGQFYWGRKALFSRFQYAVLTDRFSASAPAFVAAKQFCWF